MLNFFNQLVKNKLFFLVFLCFLFITMSYASLSSCDEGDMGYSRTFNNPGNFTLNVGFGVDKTFVPDEIEITYLDPSCTTISGYHANNISNYNGPNENSVNFWYKSAQNEINTNSVILFDMDFVSGDSTHWEAVFWGYVFLTSSTYTISVDESVTSGDPFNGAIQNDISNRIAYVQMGSESSPCRYKLLREANETGDPVGSSVSITLTNKNGSDACQFLVFARDESEYISSINVTDFNTTINNGEFSPRVEASLLYNGTNIGFLVWDNGKIRLLDENGNPF